MGIQRTVICRGKNHSVGEGGTEFSAYFAAPEPEGSRQIGNDESVPARDYAHIEGLTQEEWAALTPGQSYTLTIG